MTPSFTRLPVPLPPMLCDYAQLGNNQSRYVAFYYSCTKPTWTDGFSAATFNYYNVWHPWISHFLMEVHLLHVDLGSDDGAACSVLLVDRTTNQIFLAPYLEGIRFCHTNNPQPTVESLVEYLERNPAMNLSAMQKMGMHELFGGYNAELAEWRENLIDWLDRQLDEASTAALLKLYIREANRGNMRAMHAIVQFRDRLQQSIAFYQSQGAES